MPRFGRTFHLTDVLLAISHPTRRAIVRQLANGPARFLDIAKPFDTALNAVTKHLKLLERASLIERRRKGREVLISIRGEPLREVAGWVPEYERFWSTRLHQVAIPAPPDEVFDAWLNPKIPGNPWNAAEKFVMDPKIDGLLYWTLKGTSHYGRFTEVERGAADPMPWSPAPESSWTEAALPLSKFRPPSPGKMGLRSSRRHLVHRLHHLIAMLLHISAARACVACATREVVC
ncbi:MAG TPA: metalloregulator ArsR/SmtB family transcription factor [Spirochaetia bacterium]|nr:metalloregulator ArsR/SmtB family transcription factor [Spirochaetia bacterium]